MSGCLECLIDHHLACPFLGEDDDDGWYSVHCCCGLVVDRHRTLDAKYADYTKELRRRGWSRPPDPGQRPGGSG